MLQQGEEGQAPCFPGKWGGFEVSGSLGCRKRLIPGQGGWLGLGFSYSPRVWFGSWLPAPPAAVPVPVSDGELPPLGGAVGATSNSWCVRASSCREFQQQSGNKEAQGRLVPGGHWAPALRLGHPFPGCWQVPPLLCVILAAQGPCFESLFGVGPCWFTQLCVGAGVGVQLGFCICWGTAAAGASMLN